MRLQTATWRCIPSGACLFGILAATHGCGDYFATELSGVISEGVHTVVSNITTTPSERACTPVPNRCGPPGLGLFIPDCPLGIVCFIEACNGHDVCYATCGTSQATCDNEFFADLTAVCSDDFTIGDVGFLRCVALAYVYWQAVARYGQRPFGDAQDRACTCGEHDRSPTAHARRIVGSAGGMPPFDDYDDDLMPDDWEKVVGLDPTDPTDAMVDFDSDGLVNLGEFIRDTDPLTPDAYEEGGNRQLSTAIPDQNPDH